ncbi:MAG: hypothetical protein ACQEQL_00070 [Pseudomonadota bacterium]
MAKPHIPTLLKSKKHSALFLCVILASLFAYGCSFIGGANGGYHYKVIVEVETPEGMVTGSAIRAVSFKDGLRLPESGPSIRSQGEAVVVDLGDRGILFALTSFDNYRSVFAAFPGPPGLTPEGIDYYESLVGQRASLPVEYYPKFVSFEDLTEPLSVFQIALNQKQSVKLKALGRKKVGTMEEAFGTGVSVHNVSIEITDEQVTQKIESLLPWLKEIGGRYLDGESTGGGPDLFNILHSGNFKNER